MLVGLLEPFFGESHKALFRGIRDNCVGLKCAEFTLPASNWQWRLRHGAWHLATQVAAASAVPSVLLASDYVDVPRFRALCPRAHRTPVAVYFLEDQLSYPLSDAQRREFEFCAANLFTAMASERIVFPTNSAKNAFLSAIPEYLNHDPDMSKQTVEQTVEALRAKAQIIPIGMDHSRFHRARCARQLPRDGPLRVVWPHRWQPDKNPDEFVRVLLALHGEGLAFDLYLLGQSFRHLPASLVAVQESLSAHIKHSGYLSGDAYAEVLAAGDVVVSTALQETQGLAVIEAVVAGCEPLLPNRLSYPEVLAEAEQLYPGVYLYKNEADLRKKLRWAMRNPERVRARATERQLWQHMQRFSWESVAPQFDALVRELAGGSLHNDDGEREGGAKRPRPSDK